jgi:hypothetical protein
MIAWMARSAAVYGRSQPAISAAQSNAAAKCAVSMSSVPAAVMPASRTLGAECWWGPAQVSAA